MLPVRTNRIGASNVSPEFTINYTPTDDLTLFASYKQAYKSGSFSIATLPRAGIPNDFGDEKVQGAEVGLKARLIDRSLLLNLYDEYAPWRMHFYNIHRAASGIDANITKLPNFFPGYRGGHQTMQKIMSLFNVEMAGGEERYHTLYDSHIPADLMALSGRLQSAEDRGEIERLGLDSALLEQRQIMLEQARRRDKDMEAWFDKLMKQYTGEQVKINGTFSDLYRVARSGLDRGMRCEFAPGSIMIGGGGMKGCKDAPSDWEDQIKYFFGIDKLINMYGFSECIGNAPICDVGYFHFSPYSVSLLMDADGQAMQREGVQTGRLVLIDPIPTSYWGGFTSGDKVTMHWNEDCDCGWGGPRAAKTIRRFAEKEGGDDKITCAGSQQAYNEFMQFVAGDA